jgi:hypothetical protein
VLKLGQLLTGFQAGGPDRTDPVVLLAAAWPEMVGQENARNSGPSQIQGDTLLITTTSSAWSHSLSFLTTQLLAAIATRLPDAGIDKLRFRVGKIVRRPERSAPVRPAQDALRQVRGDALPPPQTATEALERFRGTIEEGQRAKRALGWKECEGCTALIDPVSGAYCAPCLAAWNEERERRVSRLLYEAPWLGYAGTAKLVEGLSSDEYEGIRERLLRRWWDRLSRARLSGKVTRDNSERSLASSYVLLKTNIAPEKLALQTVRNVLGDELFKLIYETEP